MAACRHDWKRLARTKPVKGAPRSGKTVRQAEGSPGRPPHRTQLPRDCRLQLRPWRAKQPGGAGAESDRIGASCGPTRNSNAGGACKSAEVSGIPTNPGRPKAALVKLISALRPDAIHFCWLEQRGVATKASRHKRARLKTKASNGCFGLDDDDVMGGMRGLTCKCALQMVMRPGRTPSIDGCLSYWSVQGKSTSRRSAPARPSHRHRQFSRDSVRAKPRRQASA